MRLCHNLNHLECGATVRELGSGWTATIERDPAGRPGIIWEETPGIDDSMDLERDIDMPVEVISDPADWFI